jgi:hypothetical protein
VVKIVLNGSPSLQSAMFDFTIDGFKYFAFLQDSEVTFTEVNGESRMKLSGVVKLPYDESGKVWDQTALAGTKVALEMPFGINVGKAAGATLSVTAPNK